MQKTLDLRENKTKNSESLADLSFADRDSQSGNRSFTTKEEIATQQPDKKNEFIAPRKRSTSKRKLLILLGFLTLIIGLVVYTIIIPLLNIKGSFDKIQSEAKVLMEGIKTRSLLDFDSRIDNIRLELNKIGRELESFQFLGSIEITKGYYQNISTASNIVKKTSETLKKSEPELKSVLELSGFIGDSVIENDESLINSVLKNLPSYLDVYTALKPDIQDILNEFNNVDLDYIPEVPGLGLKEKVVKINNLAVEFPETSKKVEEFLIEIPKLVGSNGNARYLIILQNETEMRSSGGLLSAFGNMKFANGKLDEEINLSDIWDLEDYLSLALKVDVGYRNIYAQDYLMYGRNGAYSWQCGSSYLRAQDSGIYPDLSLTMKMLSDYYNIANKYNKEMFPDYDYIVILDYQFAADLIKLIEPIELSDGTNLNSENLYDIIKFESDAENAGPDRKDIIGRIANAAKANFFDLDINKLPGIVSTFVNAFQAKDLALAAPKDDQLQDYFDKFGMSGRIVQDYDGDYFHFNEAQNCSLKLNRFIRDSVNQNVFIDSSGGITRNLNITWTQPKVFEPGLEKQYPTGLSHSYRAWVRIFTPEGTSSFESDGYQRSGYLGYKPITYFDKKMDKQISDNIIQFDHRRFAEEDPIYRDEMNISYTLPATINYINDGQYSLLLQKHPGKPWGEPYKITIHFEGQEYSAEFVLDRDKLLTFKDGTLSVDNYDKSLDWVTNLLN